MLDLRERWNWKSHENNETLVRAQGLQPIYNKVWSIKNKVIS